MRDQERLAWYDDPATGHKASSLQTVAFHLTCYMTAFSVALDRKEKGLLNRTYLDYGCGTGAGTQLVSLAFPEAAGYDLDEKAIAYARRFHNPHRKILFSGIPGTNAKYDYITCIEALEHMEVADAERVVKFFHEHLDDKGTLFLTTPIATTRDGVNPENQYHVHEYSVREMNELLGKYFTDVGFLPLFDGTMVLRAEGPK